MRYLCTIILVLGVTAPLGAEQIGAELPLEDQESVDGWSGIPVFFGWQLPAGESVTTVRYYLDDDRIGAEDELYNVVPLIIKQEEGTIDEGDGIFSVWEIGPAHTATDIGEQEFEWTGGSRPIPDDGNLYHPGALQWQQDVNNDAGGAISFGSDGDGMHFFDVDTTDYVPNEDIGEVEEGLELGGPFDPILTIHSSAPGGRLYQLNFETGSAGHPGDFDGSGMLDAPDINLLTEATGAEMPDGKFDINGDGAVDQTDRELWVETPEYKNSYFGDANLDGEFNSSDFVAVFTAGKFETETPALWEEGDWDGDGQFNSSDFVIAFARGGFEEGPRAAAVPEPASLALLLIGTIGLWFANRRGTAA